MLMVGLRVGVLRLLFDGDGEFLALPVDLVLLGLL